MREIVLSNNKGINNYCKNNSVQTALPFYFIIFSNRSQISLVDADFKYPKYFCLPNCNSESSTTSSKNFSNEPYTNFSANPQR